MNKSGSLCPAIKSADIIGDKWILLILREMFLGSSRFNDFQRALPRISPTILSKRLKKLEADGLIIRKASPCGKTLEYRLTRSGRELGPVLEQMATWGLRWARRSFADEDLDAGTFMWDFHRTLKVEALPGGQTVICVKLQDGSTYSTWWLVINDQTVDLCTDDPGRDIDVYISSSLATLVEVWMGDTTVRSALTANTIMLTGAPHLTRSPASWFPRSPMADVRPEQVAG